MTTTTRPTTTKAKPATSRAHRIRLWAARLHLAARLAGIHKEAWIPVAVVLAGAWATGPTPWVLLPVNVAAWLAWQWRTAGAYHRNAQDTMLAQFHYRWTLAQLDEPAATPHLVAVHLERATRDEAKTIRANQGRHALPARSMTLTVRAQPNQVDPKWMGKWVAATQARFGFQAVTDPRPAPLDANATELTFTQDRLPTEVRAVVA